MSDSLQKSLLLVEDDTTLADGLTRILRQFGEVTLAQSGTLADSILTSRAFDLIVLDIGLPSISGLEVLRRLRFRNGKSPVFILSAAGAVDQRVNGLDLGADDYLAKPFAIDEFEARVRAVIRRTSERIDPVVEIGKLRFDGKGRRAHIGEQLIDLTSREFRLLDLLISRSDRLVTKQQIVSHLCEINEEISDNAVEVYLHRLRKKLDGSDVKISTVRGIGYYLQSGSQNLIGE